MSRTFLRGLALLDAIDQWGPLTVTALAERTGFDETVVSRMVAACEPDGWVTRRGGKISLGPRAALLGHGSPGDQAVREAEPLVHALAGVTGLLSQAYGLTGSHTVLLASAHGPGRAVPSGLAAKIPLWATAAGKVIATQLDAGDLDAILPPDPFPGVAALVADFPNCEIEQLFPPDRSAGPSGLPADRRELLAQLEVIRRDGVATDLGEVRQGIGGIAVPWPRAGFPATLACVGPAGRQAVDWDLAERALRAAAAPAASPQDVITAAAEVIGERLQEAGQGASRLS